TSTSRSSATWRVVSRTSRSAPSCIAARTPSRIISKRSAPPSRCTRGPRPWRRRCASGSSEGESMLNDELLVERTAEAPAETARPPAWHVLWTRSNSERLVADQLAAKGFSLFLPTLDAWTRRGAARRRCQVPMFPGYVFLHHALDKWSDVEVRKARGLVMILGESWERRAVVPDAEIEAIRRLTDA